MGKRVPFIETKLEELTVKIRMTERVLFYINFVEYYMGIGDCVTAIDWLDKILSEKSRPFTEETYIKAKVLEIICHHELENHELVESLVQSTYRFLNKKQKLHPSEAVILRLFRNDLPKAIGEKAEKAVFHEAQEALQLTMEDASNERNNDFLFVLAWMKALANNSDIPTVLKKMATETVS